MDTDNIESTLSTLKDKVSEFTSKNNLINSFSKQSGIISKINFKSSIIFYGIIPVVIILILFFWKPNFIMQEIITDDDIPQYKINIKKLLILTLILSVIGCLLLFSYFYKKHN